ncbi:glycoside hydrolase family 99-like domain-containing protein [Sphingomonas sp.]|uniref:glycosyltransferase WbsX family protein n=1 Tax=Sphingomonas sp. TaxID=28214 RepID=UPI003CC6AEE8
MTAFHDHYRFYRQRGPLFEAESALPAAAPVAPAARYIAYYLPQFHPIAENDRWWGAGFTEWTNVTGGLPRYVGHYQPRCPADLGFYDLRDAGVLRRQAELAKRAGVHGFCIHHYWFSGVRLLEKPLDLLLANPDIDLPFCLNWANESWSRRWDGSESDILMEQRYAPGDDIAFAESILPALADPRYITVGGRPLLLIYRPGDMPEPRRTMDAIRDRIVRAGLPDPLIVMPQVFEAYDPRPFGMDAAAGFPPHGGPWSLPNDRASLQLLDPAFAGTAIDYAAMAQRLLENRGGDYQLFPCVAPCWDNEARKGRASLGFYGSTPARYGAWLRAASRRTCEDNSGDARLVFINAWNEWAEGAYLEPDRHFGHAYLAETRRALDGFEHADAAPEDAPAYPPPAFRASPSPRHRIVDFARRARRKAARLL